MGTIEEYKARNRDRDARRAEKEKPPEKRRWWFNQPIPIDRFTGWLVAWTALLFCATVSNVIVINQTDEKIGGQLSAMNEQVKEAKNQRLLLIEQTRANFRRNAPTIERFEPRQPDGTTKLIGYLITPRWTNVGSTSAQAVLGWYGLQVFDATFDAAILKDRKCPPISAPDVPAKSTAVAQGSSLAQGAQLLLYKDALAAANQSKFILLSGHFQYRDVYYPTTSEHHEDWCIHLFPNDLDKSIFSPFEVEDEAD